MRGWLTLALIIAPLLLAGCGGRSELAPVRDRAGTPQHASDHHTVRQGETLYSIAWLYGLDHKKLARYNGIKSPYRIYVGQRLGLKPQATAARTTATRPAPSSSSTGKSVTSSASKPRATASRPKGTPQPKPASEAYNSDRSVAWRWPSSGKVRTRFSSRRVAKKGMTIAGALKSSVLAAADGKVVYSGNGLIGYGNLIIIKHSKSYLSAYGFNHRLLVKEGAMVKRGQRIAEMGRDGNEPPGLYFEIRRNGKPINPEAVLPRKR